MTQNFTFKDLMKHVSKKYIIVAFYQDDGSENDDKYSEKVEYFKFDTFDESADFILGADMLDWYVKSCRKCKNFDASIEDNVICLAEGGDVELSLIFQSDRLATDFYKVLKKRCCKK